MSGSIRTLSPERVGPHTWHAIHTSSHHGTRPSLVTADQVLEHRSNKVQRILSAVGRNGLDASNAARGGSDGAGLRRLTGLRGKGGQSLDGRGSGDLDGGSSSLSSGGDLDGDRSGGFNCSRGESLDGSRGRGRSGNRGAGAGTGTTDSKVDARLIGLVNRLSIPIPLQHSHQQLHTSSPSYQAS